jgi:signal transduction histidine kinase
VNPISSTDPAPQLNVLRHDRLLEATAKATNVLLTMEDLEPSVSKALGIIGEGIGCDLVLVLENVYEVESPPLNQLPSACDLIYAWASPDFQTLPADFNPSMPVELLGVDFLEQYFLNGNGFGGPVEQWDGPLRSWLVSMQIASAYAVPIRVKGEFWGALCLDYRRANIEMSPAEVSVLMTIADCIGSAIQRNRLQQERQTANQQITADLEAYNQMLQRRDRLLETTAKATKILLTADNFDAAMMSALKIIGEGIGCDRINILENFYRETSRVPFHFTFIYEWATPEFIRDGTQLNAAPILSEQLDISFIETYFLQGDGFGGPLEVWPIALQNHSPAAEHVQSAYSVPIRSNGEWWGVLSFHYCRAAIQISSAEISVLMTIADCIGSAIQRNRTQKLILQVEQERVAELAKANDALRRSIAWLAHHSNIDAFLGHLLREFATQFAVQDAQIVLYDDKAQTFQTLIILLDGEITPTADTSKVPREQWCGWEVLLQSSKPRPFDLDTEPHLFMPICLEFHRQRGNQGVVCTLLRQDEQPLGFIEFAYRDQDTFSETALELVQSLAQQATLALQLTRLAEEAKQAALLQERTALAREIHDTLAQAFGGILMQLQAATYFGATQPEQAQTHLLTAQTLAQEGLVEARRSVWTLHHETVEYEDLVQAIAKFIQQTPAEPGIAIRLTTDGTPYRLHPDQGLNLLRIAQEAMTNALRHAQPQTVEIHLSYAPKLLNLTIRDDGCGFDPQLPTQGFGLLGMQQRAARIGADWQLVSRPGQGTTLTIMLVDPPSPAPL